MAWFVLFLAGLLEVVWATALKASDGFTKLGPSVVFGVAAFGESANLLRVASIGLIIAGIAGLRYAG